jgi:FKBP-type peptidyl-prolyl cis-trans isomerase FklB
LIPEIKKVKTMKKGLIILGAGMLLTSSAMAQAPTQTKITNKVDSISYLVGLNIGASILKDFNEANVAVLMSAIQDVMNGNPPKVNDQGNTIVNNYFQSKAQATAEKQNAESKAEGEKFMADNKKKPTVKVTASGLQYEVITEGTGEKPTATSKVKVHYHGTTPDGRVFDSSVERGEPIEFGLNQVIKGWTEGLQLMKMGGKYKFYIPQELAYGANPQPGSIIEPFMPLVFEVELLGISK